MKRLLKIVPIIVLFITNSIFSQSKALVVFKKGKSYVINNNQKKEIKINTILNENDIIKTEKDAYVNLQLSNGVLIRVGGNTQITLNKIVRKDNNEEFGIQLSQGEVLSKVEKDKKKKIKLDIQSPTAIASVRGTEFFVEAEKDSSTIAVNEGKVEVSSIDGSQKQTVEAGEKIIATFKEMKKSILETYEKQKFEMLQELEKTKKQNFENVIKQIEKNQQLIEEQKNKIQFPENPFQK
ncbi:MAG: hypothetical protein KatS3mg129_1771 [Leptospiraceae bacterium]|nr:MAG: hypothetical protein KatS3mg129_1771 [Leptospiraceae bacterium]